MGHNTVLIHIQNILISEFILSAIFNDIRNIKI
jgi:hypothetical protein